RGRVTTLAAGARDIDPGAALDLRVLAGLLTQFDVRISGIDVHVRTERAAGPPVIARAVERLLGPVPAAARRDAVVLLRLAPDDCPTAVARRGGGERGAVRSAGVAAARIVRALTAGGLVCRMLSAADVDRAVARFAG